MARSVLTSGRGRGGRQLPAAAARGDAESTPSSAPALPIDSSIHQGTDPLLPEARARHSAPTITTLDKMRRCISDTPAAASPRSCESSDSEEGDSLPLTQPPDIMPPPTPHLPFQSINADYVTPDDSSYPPVPPNPHSAIQKMCKDVFGVDAREYQIRAIFYHTYLKISPLYSIRKTGEGKSLVMMGTATILRGVTICLVPLLGLGSSQASKSTIEADRVEGYHLDEYRDTDFDALSQRMRTYSRNEAASIIVYISPQKLLPGSPWYSVLSAMAGTGFISFICVDEAHSVAEQSRSFRPEFRDAI
jgi:hypothetical protein